MPGVFPAPDEPTPPWSPGTPVWRATELPPDARRMGLSPWVAPELQLASNLRADKKFHRVLAWIGLVVSVALVLAPLVGILL
ncbi:hypothetical protein [Allobranchiibius sp. CTAmp26]|uniref:hypothetical protein n=1 Tax=Allobranchiibius sp. CTAmp26 TaxID=2815214 RepID=UPI001AA1C0A2|nr:hypothetical protein [Allobranchiibius sp. CTAmp26]MBO1754667.1 hypothetical protein [Allobranchiibius sp. CTAmp26]